MGTAPAEATRGKEAGLLRAARAGVSETYMRLAMAVPNSEIELTAEYLLCQGPSDLAFCNFAGAFAFSSAEGLRRLALRVEELPNVETMYVMTGDGPADSGEVLADLGWSARSDMVMMAWEPGEPAAEASGGFPAPKRCATRTERVEAGAFMTEQFFSRGHRDLKQSIIRATAASPHELYLMELEGEPVAGVMLTRHEESLGLYNLCVEFAHRSQGIGGALVRLCQVEAAQKGVPLTLQCAPLISGYYSGFGFRCIGLMSSLGPPERDPVL